MKIELEIPDRAKGRYIYVFGGIEMLAVKYPDEEHFQVVVEGCKRCGKCCRDMASSKDWIFYDEEKGSCRFLKDLSGGITECSLGAYRPFGCSTSAGKEPEYCQIKKVKQPE